MDLYNSSHYRLKHDTGKLGIVNHSAKILISLQQYSKIH